MIRVIFEAPDLDEQPPRVAMDACPRAGEWVEFEDGIPRFITGVTHHPFADHRFPHPGTVTVRLAPVVR